MVCYCCTKGWVNRQKAFPRNLERARKSKFVRVALGLHPQLVADRAPEVSIFEELLPDIKYIGEIGLDAYPRFYRSFDKQNEVFESVLRACSRVGNKVLSVHSAHAAKHVLDMIETCLHPDRGRVVLHRFTGSPGEARRAVGMGCYFSVNERMFNSPKFEALLQVILSDRILTETDGPFVVRNGSPVAPGEVTKVLARLAKHERVEEHEIERRVQANFAYLVK
ncbi:Qat anti-phage system TatD family nuclease QatD [Ruegeria sp.]|uniref:Qat anti-phage system TatD family nuclease QatD n=1 Tax=Ruegeria sp. TaxID=1879320 RepID=UPI003B5A67EF